MAAASVLAAGVLGVAGWGVYSRSQRVAAAADKLPLPTAVEVANRQWVAAQISAGITGPLKGLTDDLVQIFLGGTDWVNGGGLKPGSTVVGGTQVQIIKDTPAWTVGRLLQANSLNLMALVNTKQGELLDLPDVDVGGPASFFDLTRSTPLLAEEKTLKADLAAVELYLRQKIPVPTVAP